MVVERRWWRDGGEMVIERRWRDGRETVERGGGETVVERQWLLALLRQ